MVGDGRLGDLALPRRGYEALVADPLGEVERLYGRLGLALSGPTDSA